MSLADVDRVGERFECTSARRANAREEGVVLKDSGTLQLGSLSMHWLEFGSMQLIGSGVWRPPHDHDTALGVLRCAVDLGVDFIDTADSYGLDVAEELIREALSAHSSSLNIATKSGLTRPGPDQWEPSGHPDYFRQQCESSLEQFDLYQLHCVDTAAPADEQFGALRELRHEGKVVEVGLSEVCISQIEAALRVVPIVSAQNQYNVAERRTEDVLNFCEHQKIGFVPRVPLACGRLSEPDGPIGRFARELGAIVSRLSLSWLLRRSPAMAPIPGTSSFAHLEENCAAAAISLTDAQCGELSGVDSP